MSVAFPTSAVLKKKKKKKQQHTQKQNKNKTNLPVSPVRAKSTRKL